MNKQLTERERQIVEKVLEGLTSKEIAKYYELSIHTVRNHRKNIMKRFGLRKATQMGSLLNNQHQPS